MKRLLLIDSNSLIHRAYHALPALTGPGGEPTGALYGFTSMLLKALREMKPDYVAACLDLPGPTFRHETFAAYKATRPKTPEELANQIEKSKEILTAFGIPALSAPSYEADDIIGTAANAVENEKDLEVIILSGDLDILQLASDRVKIYTMRKGISDTVIYDKYAVKARYGFEPELLPDYKALRGDPSDNIPGVPGIGEKTASALVAKFGSLERVYKETEKHDDGKNHLLTESVRQKLISHQKTAFLSKELATIRKSAPIEISLASFSFAGISRAKLAPLFQTLGFKTLVERIDKI